MQERYFEVDGSRLNFLWRPLAVGPPAPDTPLKPDSALNTSWLLHRHLARGEIVEAAVLSNAPRRRFEELMRYRDSVGEAAFRQVFGEYFSSDNKPVAEAAMGEYRLIVWYLGKAGALAGEYFVEVEGRYMIDDGPGETRSRLRRVLESLRAGQLPAVAASTGTTTDNIPK